MSKKKSLGSSPIGFQSKDSSMHFIPDLGVSKSDAAVTKSYSSVDSQATEESQENTSTASKQEKSEKKIVSYNLEIDLIGKVKTLANEKGMYYSTLVSTALKSWISQNE